MEIVNTRGPLAMLRLFRLLLAFVAIAGLARAPLRAAPGSPPNILFIIADELAGGTAPPGVFDGRSFRAALDGRNEALHDSIYFELGFTRGVRVGDWKYIALRYPPEPERFALTNNPPHFKGRSLPPGQPGFGHIGGNNNEMAALRTQPAYFDRDQLYSLQDDPREQRNLAQDAAHAAKLAELKRELQRHLAHLPGGFGELKQTP